MSLLSFTALKWLHNNAPSMCNGHLIGKSPDNIVNPHTMGPIIAGAVQPSTYPTQLSSNIVLIKFPQNVDEILYCSVA